MGCVAGLGRLLVVIINLIFLVIGLSLLIAGLVFRYGESLLASYYEPTINTLTTTLQSQGFGTVDTSSFKITDLITSLGIALILIGLFISIVSLFGCCGACYKIKFMLIAYAVVVILFLTGETIFCGILFGKPDLVKDNIKTPLKAGIKSDYAGFNGTNFVSLAWNFAHRTWSCCGVDGFSDFTGASNWIVNFGGLGVLSAPLSCCEVIPQSTNLTCAVTPSDYYEKGCFDIVYDMLLGNVSLVAGIAAGCGIFQLVLIILAIWITTEDKKDKIGIKFI